jgi:periplasmic protein TonB
MRSLIFVGAAMAVGNVLGAQRTMGRDAVYFEYQVERQARALPDNPPPRFPEELRARHIEGEVLAQFVVDTTGYPDTLTFKVFKTRHPLFTSAVRAALPTMRFTPAEVGGRKVKQLVQMPFNFELPAPPPPREMHE